jgi:putative oxidoreductase
MKKFFSVRSHAKDIDAILFLMRLIVGYAFILHGWGKIQTPMTWMGPGAPVPGAFQLLAAVAEFGGGIALILGLLTRLGVFGMTCTMLVAVCTHAFMLHDPFVNLTGGRSFEPATVYLLIALFFLINGPGRYSLDAKVFGIRSK